MDHLCLVFLMHLRLFIAAMWSSLGKRLTFLALVSDVSCMFVTFPCGILGRVWYLIVLVPDLCLISYFVGSNLFRVTVLCP